MTQTSDKDSKWKGKVAKNSAPSEREVELEAKVTELEALLTESRDKALRMMADYDNFRKRSFRELGDTRYAAKADTIIPMLNVLDHFRLAVAAAENSGDMNTILEGMKMISAEFARALEDLGVEQLDATGQMFDPALHEAVAKESSELEEGTVISQWRCGYRMGGKLLRPATVVVSGGADEGTPEEDANG